MPPFDVSKQRPASSKMRPYSRPLELGRRTLAAVAGCTLFALLLRYVVGPGLPPQWRSAGSPELYLTGVMGALLILVPLAFSIAKRGGRATAPRLWFIAHVLAGSLGAVLVSLHAAANWDRPPALLVILLFFLVLQGFWARTTVGDRLAVIMGSRTEAFANSGPAGAASLQGVLEDKRKLLSQLDGGADEATFSPTLGHWLAHPVHTLAYVRLTETEAGLIRARQTIDPVLSRWRRLHMLAAWLLVAGLIVHIITVTFFAGYVADGGEITWWHLTAWGK